MWNTFLGPKRSCSCLGHHTSKWKLRELSCSCKCSAWPETQYIQSASPQRPSHLWAFSAQMRLTIWPQTIRCFLFVFSLFFILYPIKTSCLPPHVKFSETASWSAEIKFVFIISIVFFNRFLTIDKAFIYDCAFLILCSLVIFFFFFVYVVRAFSVLF